jgi:DNA-binding transcriptional LysR family regulator
MQRFSLTQLSYFVATASLNSLSEAARHLHVSQPSISAAISHIEQTLRYSLFTRHNRFGVRLTAEGRKVFDQARHILALVDDLGAENATDDRELSGQVSIGCFDPLASLHLPALMRSLADAYPRLSIRYEVRRQPALHEAVLSGDLSLVLTYDTGVWEDVPSTTLGHVIPFVIVGAEHKLAHRASVSLMDIVDEDYVLIDWPESKEYQLGLFSATGRLPKVVAYAPNLEMLRGMVAHGFGISISVTRPVSDTSYDGRSIICIPISDPIPLQRVVICHPDDRYLTRASRVVMDHIVAYFRAAQAG